MMGGCECFGVAPGSYANQEVRFLPFATARYPAPGTKPVAIDRCILPTIEELWRDGIETVESCCGHRRTAGYIAVAAEHVEAMERRGYLPDPNTQSTGVFLWPKGDSNA